MTLFTHPEFDHHEQVQFCEDARSGLRAIIAIHDTTLGAAVGGCRMYNYADEQAALSDVLRLSRGMTYKSALAGLPMGGGKSVIIADPAHDKSPQLLLAMAESIDRLGGRYIAAEDSGTSVADMKIMAQRTAWVSGINDKGKHGGDPSPTTAYGVYVAIQAAVRHRLGERNLNGIAVAIQGLGNVGYHLASYLMEAGAEVFGADLNVANVERAVSELGITAVPVEEILCLRVDVLAPCAMGAVLDDLNISQLQAGIVAGAANNQLAHPHHAQDLRDRGILYCPDFLINAGGIIDVHFQRQGEAGDKLRRRVERIGDHLGEILARAERQGLDTHSVAESVAEEILTAASLQKAG
ncbi:MAG: leucine dehydrogenase [Halieaceae bacterium]|jgi:leucine dehydrogenase